MMRISLSKMPYVPKQTVKKVAKESASFGFKASQRAVISYGCINALKAAWFAGPFWGLFKGGLVAGLTGSPPLVAIVGISAASITLAKRLKPMQKAVTKLSLKV
jgi:hypothetical protein